MLPKPFINFVPKFFNRDEKLIAFANKIDELMDSFESDILGLNTVIDPFRIPAIMVDELGYYLNAGILSKDSDREKRIKIAYAIKSHKFRGTFKFDIKPKIDTIAGGDSEIVKSTDGDDWIMGGDGTSVPAAYYWASMGIDGIDDDLGIGLIGEGIEIEIAGNIYIDVDNNSLSSADQQKIVDIFLENFKPAYLRIFIGYVDGSGNFVVYTYIE